MDKTKSISGLIAVFDSSRAENFRDAAKYPLAWEVVFVNDSVGKEFAANVRQAFAGLPEEKGYVLSFEEETTAPVRCLECVFRDKAAFVKILNETMRDIAFYDEQEKGVVPKYSLLEEAGRLSSTPAPAAG